MSITVVIPAYNAARYIEATLKSVLAQTLPPDEVLVIDDGSKDNTAEIAQSFNGCVKVFRRANAGQGASRNFGVQQATSEWIALMDSDDLWVPHKLERQMLELAANPQADVCYSARVRVTQADPSAPLAYLAVVPAPEAGNVRRALHRNTSFLPSSVLIRRSTYLAHGGFDPHFIQVQDWEFWLRLLHGGVQFAACAEPLMLYRVHIGSISHNGLRALQFQDEIYRRHILPNIPQADRKTAYTRFRSEHEAAASLVLRRRDDLGYFLMMTRSIARDPLHTPQRYKIWLHMLYTTLLRQDVP